MLILEKLLVANALRLAILTVGYVFSLLTLLSRKRLKLLFFYLS